MKTVCHILSGDLWAGAEVMAFHLLKELNSKEGLRISVILLNHGRLADELIKHGMDVCIIDETQHSFFDIILKIKKKINQLNPDVVHSHRYKENIISFVVTMGTTGVKRIATQHGMPEVINNKVSVPARIISGLNQFLLKKKFYRLVCVSNDIKKCFIEQFGFQEHHLCVIHNGVEAHPEKDSRRDPGYVCVGSAGRFFPVKDYSLLIEIARNVHGKNKNIVFRLAGDGPEKEKLISLVQHYGLKIGSFDFKGHVDDMSSFYRELDIYINTSVHEGIPMSILEAMSFGLPIIAPDVGGIGEIVTDAVEGFLLKGRNPVIFADKIIELAENLEMMRDMASHAESRVIEFFSVQVMAEKYVYIYHLLS